MYNSDTPIRAELPTSRQLVRSTVLAAVAAVALLVAVVLPAEYGVDPTGIGRVLGLTEMGTTKKQLAAQSAADKVIAAPTATLPGTQTTVTAATQTVAPNAVLAVEWRDETPITLAAGQGLEIKLVMVQGAKAQYAWTVDGGEVNFDTHADGQGKSISYEKGRGVSAKEGVLEAAFTGNHGWYWRNRGKAEVKIILRTRGEYTAIKK